MTKLGKRTVKRQNMSFRAAKRELVGQKQNFQAFVFHNKNIFGKKFIFILLEKIKTM
jgi:hypothetical protein